MMTDQLHMDCFERRIVGLRGTVLLRRNAIHSAFCVVAIRRREHPAWSQHHGVEGFRVSEGRQRGRLRRVA